MVYGEVSLIKFSIFLSLNYTICYWITMITCTLITHQVRLVSMGSQQTRDVQPMLVQCWPTVFDAGPTLFQHWVNVSCSRRWPNIVPTLAERLLLAGLTANLSSFLPSHWCRLFMWFCLHMCKQLLEIKIILKLIHEEISVSVADRDSEKQLQVTNFFDWEAQSVNREG